MAVQHLADPERKRFDDKRLFHVRICRCIEPLAQQPVYSSFEGLFGAPHFVLQGAGDVFVDGEEASRCQPVKALVPNRSHIPNCPS
jgi:hypothetical protein